MESILMQFHSMLTAGWHFLIRFTPPNGTHPKNRQMMHVLSKRVQLHSGVKSLQPALLDSQTLHTLVMEARLAASTTAQVESVTKNQSQSTRLAQLWRVQLHSGVKSLQLASLVSQILHTPAMEARPAVSTIVLAVFATKNQSLPTKLVQSKRVQLHSGVKSLQLALLDSQILHTPAMEARPAVSTTALVVFATSSFSDLTK